MATVDKTRDVVVHFPKLPEDGEVDNIQAFKLIANRNPGRWLVGLAIALCFWIMLGTESISQEGDSIPELVSALAGEDAVARFMAEEQLVKMGDTAVSVLKPLATSQGSTPARQYAINILASIDSQKALSCCFVSWNRNRMLRFGR